jgi:D-serine deaminase-like pyridoxal phosphate-dependent protein
MRPTPNVQVYARIVDANINSMQEFCDSRGIALRPHAKTHKAWMLHGANSWPALLG